MIHPIILLLVFAVATVLGYILIKQVPSLLHTPLMSGMNALSGITVLGMVTSTALAVGFGSQLLGCVGIICAMVNVVAGFGVTDKMLKMFKGSSAQEGKGHE